MERTVGELYEKEEAPTERGSANCTVKIPCSEITSQRKITSRTCTCTHERVRAGKNRTLQSDKVN